MDTCKKSCDKVKPACHISTRISCIFVINSFCNLPNSLQILLHDAPRILKSTVQKEKIFLKTALLMSWASCSFSKALPLQPGKLFYPCAPPIRSLKRDLRPAKEFINRVTWEKMLLKLLHWGKNSPDRFDVKMTQKRHDVKMPSCRQILKQLDSKRHGYA